jgi:hypothetical protein
LASPFRLRAIEQDVATDAPLQDQELAKNDRRVADAKDLKRKKDKEIEELKLSMVSINGLSLVVHWTVFHGFLVYNISHYIRCQNTHPRWGDIRYRRICIFQSKRRSTVVSTMAKTCSKARFEAVRSTMTSQCLDQRAVRAGFLHHNVLHQNLRKSAV